MGQGEDHKDVRRDHGRGNPQRKVSLAHFAALVGLTLAATSCAASATPSQTAPPPQYEFDKARAWAHLVKQVEFGPRVPGTPGHADTADYLMAELKKTCEKVYTQEFSHTWSATGRPVAMKNIIGEYNWGKTDTNVLLFAHWDTRPTADEEYTNAKRQTPILGANDGASGVAVLLELMRVLKERKAPLGVMILFTDGEDLGPGLEEMFLGARHFAHNLPSPRPDYAVLLDMVGDKDLRIPIEAEGYGANPALARAFYANARNIGLGETFPNQIGDPVLDDHIPLIEAGIPSIDLIDFNYPYWHTLQDTADKCSPDSLEKVGTALESWMMKPKPWKPGRRVLEH